MHAILPESQNRYLPPLKMTLKTYLELSRSFSEALEELESRYPQRQRFPLEDRRHSLLKQQPR
jgi:hypothetical protein